MLIIQEMTFCSTAAHRNDAKVFFTIYRKFGPPESYPIPGIDDHGIKFGVNGIGNGLLLIDRENNFISLQAHVKGIIKTQDDFQANKDDHQKIYAIE